MVTILVNHVERPMQFILYGFQAEWIVVMDYRGLSRSDLPRLAENSFNAFSIALWDLYSTPTSTVGGYSNSF